MNIYLDIETIRSSRADLKAHFEDVLEAPKNMSKEETIKDWWDNKADGVLDEKINGTSLSGDYGEIISISWALDDRPVRNKYRMPGESEASLLMEWVTAVNGEVGKSRISLIVGHNIINFDIPFLYKRCIINNVPFPSYMPINPKPWDSKVFDTSHWAGNGKYISQNELCFILGTEQKPDGIDGSKVGEFYREGRHQEIIEYNNYDTETVRKNYKRMRQV